MAPDIISSYWWNTHEAERWKWVLNVEQHTAYLKSINPRSLFGLAPSWNWSRGCRAPRGSQFPAASPSAESGTFVFLSITNNAQRGCGALWFPRLKTQLESCCRENILLTPTTSRVEITWKRARGWPSSRHGVFTCTLTCWSTEEHSVWCSAPCEEGSLLRWWGKNVGVLSDTGERSFPTGLSVRWRAGWRGEEKDGAKGENIEYDFKGWNSNIIDSRGLYLRGYRVCPTAEGWSRVWVQGRKHRWATLRPLDSGEEEGRGWRKWRWRRGKCWRGSYATWRLRRRRQGGNIYTTIQVLFLLVSF